MLHDPPSLLCIALVVLSASALLVASLNDLIARTVPNGLPLLIALCGIGLRAAARDLPAGLLAAGIVFVIAALCWRGRLMGGGDVKLITATVLVIPPAAVLSFIAAVAVAGGVLAFAYLMGRLLVQRPGAQRPRNLFARILRVERWRIARGGPLPYACAIAAGGLFILL